MTTRKEYINVLNELIIDSSVSVFEALTKDLYEYGLNIPDDTLQLATIDAKDVVCLALDKDHKVKVSMIQMLLKDYYDAVYTKHSTSNAPSDGEESEEKCEEKNKEQCEEQSQEQNEEQCEEQPEEEENEEEQSEEVEEEQTEEEAQ